MKLVVKSVLSVAVLFGSFAASAANQFVYVGSWNVNQGPAWAGTPPNGPLAYTGLEAAALLFGGNPTDYAISTVQDAVNHLAWYDQIGVGQGTFAEGYSNKYLGQYYGPTSGYGSTYGQVAASAYVRDNTSGLTNYAFRITAAVPEPETYAMLLAGMGLIGAFAKRRKVK
jgi:hypothetical protein